MEKSIWFFSQIIAKNSSKVVFAINKEHSLCSRYNHKQEIFMKNENIRKLNGNLYDCQKKLNANDKRQNSVYEKINRPKTVSLIDIEYYLLAIFRVHFGELCVAVCACDTLNQLKTKWNRI